MEYRLNIHTQMKGYYSIFFSGEYELKPNHTSLYFFLLNQNNRSNWVEWFKCPYDLAMMGSGINSKATYYKVLTDLQKYKLIEYEKGINDYKAPKIKIISLSSVLNNIPLSEQLNEPLLEPLHEQLYIPQPIQLPVHIYKLITDNIKPITDNFNKFEKFILNLNKTKPDNKINLDFITDLDFKNLIQEWFDYKKSKNESYKNQKSVELFIKKLLELSKNDYLTARKIIEQSMANNWAGIFELKKQQTIKSADYRTSSFD